MKLVQYHQPGVGLRVGVAQDGQVREVRHEVAHSVLSLVEIAKDAKDLTNTVTQVLERRPGEQLALSDLCNRPSADQPYLLTPITAPQVWGAGVTYQRSAEMRDEDSGTNIYDGAYFGKRPELFFKATPAHCVGTEANICIRSDSQRTAAEPELAVVLGQGNQIIGYTLCNDVSAWDIERENPLYLPQSKIYQGCCALGPVLLTADAVPDPYQLELTCRIHRNGAQAYQDSCSVGRMRRKLAELVGYLVRHNPVPVGTVLSTGTGIITPEEMMLRPGDIVELTMPEIGTLRNPVARLSA